MATGNRSNVILECKESSFRYHTTKNKKKNPKKLKLKKYDPVTRKHVWFTEKK